MKLMVVDAREQGEPETYIIDTDKAKPPRHMMRMIVLSVDKCFKHIMDDGAASMGGLVDEESESADDRAEEIFQYLDSHCKQENEYKPGMSSCVYISIAGS